MSGYRYIIERFADYVAKAVVSSICSTIKPLYSKTLNRNKLHIVIAFSKSKNICNVIVKFKINIKIL